MSSSHNAARQMLGYLYQLRYALYLLLTNEDPLHQLSMEKYDDVAFDSDGEPRVLVQVKHHLRDSNHTPSLSDASVDLWRTLNAWLDSVSEDSSLLDHTEFVIITTASVPAGSVAEHIKSHDIQKAYSALAKVAESASVTNTKYCSKFLKTDKDLAVCLLDGVRIIDSASDIVGIEEDIRSRLRYSCTPNNEDSVLERVEGWWFKCCIKALSSSDPTIMTQGQLRAKVIEISQQYSDDNLPIEFLDLEAIDERSLARKDKVFLEQLKLLHSSSRTLNNALQDYYRACRQRSSWLRQGLVYANELDAYEGKLVDEWDHAFGLMEDKLSIVGDSSDGDAVAAGIELYGEMMTKDLRIRPLVDAQYVMRGTYHHLANDLKVGWHVDFVKRLRRLMEDEYRL